MTKGILTAVFALLVAVSPSRAGIEPVNVDFNILTGNTDITVGGSPGFLTLDGITFTFLPSEIFPPGDPPPDPIVNPLDFGNIDSNGVFGSTHGTLHFDFAAPAVGLRFTYHVLSVPPPVPPLSDSNPSLSTFFSNGDAPTVAGTAGAGEEIVDITGNLVYTTGSPFTSVDLWFSPVVVDLNGTAVPYFFDLNNLSYDPAVPEPGTFALFGCGVILLGAAKMRRKS